MVDYLTKKDKKILSILDLNARMPYSQIAKLVAVSKETCMYRIQRMKDKGVILRKSTLINLGSIGLFSHKMYLKLHGLSDARKKEMLRALQLNSKINWIAATHGCFDLIIAFLCRNIREFHNEKGMILERYANNIHEYSVGIMSETRIYSRAYFSGRLQTRERTMMGTIQLRTLDAKDKSILQELTADARTPITEIARKLNMNTRTAMTRIQKLTSTGIIQGYTLFLNLKSMGYAFYKAFITIGSYSPDEYKKFLQYCKVHRHIVRLVESVGSWELEPEFEVENEQQFYTIIDGIKKDFPKFIKSIESVRIEKEHKAMYCPVEAM